MAADVSPEIAEQAKDKDFHSYVWYKVDDLINQFDALIKQLPSDDLWYRSFYKFLTEELPQYGDPSMIRLLITFDS